ncbi:MAG: right-handed parallel beta-helix repeat-containing protein [Lachnospiraceae bacterium]|nr:right-handed parallel beta-helix repeat-containing protein [Lachnospiraceae bacterium]
MKKKRIGLFLAGIFAAFGLSIFFPDSVWAGEQTVKEVSTVKELADAIADDTTIIMAPGTYNLTEYLEKSKDVKIWEEGMDEPGIYNSSTEDDPEFMIRNINNLTITSEDRFEPSELVSDPRYTDVLRFSGCDNIILDALVIGHTERPELGDCAGDVICFSNSSNITITATELYGCGAYGLDAFECDHISMLYCDVHDCTYGCVYTYDTEHINFIGTDFHDCEGYTMFEFGKKPAAFIECSLRNLNGTFTDSADVTMINTEIDNCFDGFGGFGPGDTGIIEEDPDNTEQSASDDDKKTETETQKPQDSGADKTEPEKPAEKEPEKTETTGVSDILDEPVTETELIEYTVKSHPMEVEDNKKTLISGNYYEILLSDGDKKKWPELAETIDYLNKNANDDLEGFLTQNYEYARNALDQSDKDVFLEFRDEIHYVPQRTDSLVFSYALSEMLSYEASSNILARGFTFDPESGRSIHLNEVVKKIDSLPEILLTEIKKAEQYNEFFNENPDAEELFTDVVETRLQDNGEYLDWTLDYDGMRVYFYQYDFGPEELLAPSVLIPFEDYPELFYKRYVYTGEIPLGNENMNFESDAATVTYKYEELSGKETEDNEKKNTENEGIIKTLPLSWSMEVNYPENEEEYGDRYSYYTYTDIYTVSEEEYPALSEALDTYNDQSRKAIKTFFKTMKNQIDSLYTPNDDEWPTFAYERRLSLNRADDVLLSFTQYNNSTAVPDYIDSEALGINIDTQTGEYIDLLDVVVSKESLRTAAEHALESTDFYVDEWKEEALKIVNKALKNNMIISDPAGLSFTIDYQGLTLIFNGSLTGFDDGPSTIFLAFSEYPELFNDKYMQVPDNYFIELAKGDFMDIYWFDFDGDGKAEPFSVIWEPDDDGDYLHGVSLLWNDTKCELSEVDDCYELNAYLAHNNGKDYIYIDTTTYDDYQRIFIYGIDTEALYYIGCAEGNMKFMMYVDEDDLIDETEGIVYLPGYQPVDPGNFKLMTEDSIMGDNFVTADYCIDWEGYPDETGYSKYYMPEDYWYIEVKEDIDAEYVEEGSNALGASGGTLKSGTLVQPYRITENGGTLIIRSEDKKRWVVYVEKTDDGWLINGKDPDELFDNLPYSS